MILGYGVFTSAGVPLQDLQQTGFEFFRKFLNRSPTLEEATVYELMDMLFKTMMNNMEDSVHQIFQEFCQLLETSDLGMKVQALAGSCYQACSVTYRISGEFFHMFEGFTNLKQRVPSNEMAGSLMSLLSNVEIPFFNTNQFKYLSPRDTSVIAFGQLCRFFLYNAFSVVGLVYTPSLMKTIMELIVLMGDFPSDVPLNELESSEVDATSARRERVRSITMNILFMCAFVLVKLKESGILEK